MNVLVLNSGSSSLKFQLIATDLGRITQNNDERLCRGLIERIGGEAIISVQTRKGPKQTFTASLSDISEALEYLVRWIRSESGITETSSLSEIDAVGHRVVHGGELFSESAVITDEVLKGIEGCIDLAPLHNPNNIKCILASRHLFGPKLPQVAVFDTSFHHSIPEHAHLYAVPYHLYKRHHIRRYGFHGTSHRYVADRYRALHSVTEEQTHVITLHLGNGCSATAIRGGRSVDTSMGMTPLEGLVMGTRSGDIDPAIVDLIATKEGLSTHEVDALLNTQSGLLGISGLTNDMRVLLKEEREQGDRRVRLAIEVFCYRARKYIGAFLACLGGADAVVFTGGIGENSPDIRARICSGLEWAGLRLDDKRNRQMVGSEGQISSDDSSLHAFAIPTDEELLIARDTVLYISGERGKQQAAQNFGVREITLKNELPIVYLARHGETAWTLSGRHTGLTDLPLTEHGERTARRLGERLRGLTFAKVFTSPLQRARRTCELAGFGPIAEIDPDLAEWDYGKYEGRRGAEIRAEHPDWNLFRDGCPGGEMPQQVSARADRVVSRMRAIPGNLLLLFTSGHFMRVLASRWLGLEPTANSRYFMLSTASLSALGYENDLSRPVIRFWNDTRHVDIERGVAAHASS